MFIRTERQADGQTDRLMGRQADRQTGMAILTRLLMLIKSIYTLYGLPCLLLPVTYISTWYTLLRTFPMLAGYKDSLLVVVRCSLVVIMMLEQSQFNVNHDFYLSLIFLANKTKNAGEKRNNNNNS